MNRIFPSLVILSLFAMVGAAGLGLSIDDTRLRDPKDRAEQSLGTVHRLSGVAAALVVVLANSIIVTYFIGTSRWSKEVAETYQLDPQLAARGQRIKRRAFPWAVINMLIAVGIVALGGAADPGGGNFQPVAGIAWKDIHLFGALAGIAIIVFGFVRQWMSIQAQRQLIAQIMEEVHRIRAAKGLDTPAATSR